MMDIRNFEKVMNLDGSYSAISKTAETVIGFGGIRSARSVLTVTKDEDQYILNVYVTNEWGDRYTLFGAYTYRINFGHTYVEDVDWEHEEEVLNENFIFPLYFCEEGKMKFTDIVRYLTNK